MQVKCLRDKMNFKLLYFLVILSVLKIIPCKILSRKKRYLAFPEGASFSAVWCLTSQMGITDGAAIFTEGINWGLVYLLPNDTLPLLSQKDVAKRRNRRDVYGNIENVLTSMGYNGRQCMLRTLCEAERIFKNKEDSLIHHILSIIFRFPVDKLRPYEPDDHRIYHWASRLGQENFWQECYEVFKCPFSMIDAILGYYSEYEL